MRHRLALLLATPALACAVGLAAAPAASAGTTGTAGTGSSGSDLGQMSSQAVGDVNAAVRDALKGAYNGLPDTIKNDAGVKQGAKNLGLIDPPQAQAARASKSGSNDASGTAAVPAPASDCSNCVALTFDDGPAASTAELLDTLKRNDVRASFFVLAPHANAHPELLRRMAADGHTIGNHTSAHKELNKLSAAEVSSEIALGTGAIQAATGQTPRWLRPPYGATNGTVAQAASAAGQAQALWAVDTLDWKTLNTQATCDAAVGEAQAGNIILMHDIHPTTVAAAQCVIDGLRAKGLAPVSLDELIPNPNPGQIYFGRA